MAKRSVQRAAGALLLAAMAFQEDKVHYENTDFEDAPVQPKKKFIPKGCEYYHFDKDGNWTTADSSPSGTIFSCIARSEKNAIKKFNKFNK